MWRSGIRRPSKVPASDGAALRSTATITGKGMARGRKEFYCSGGGAHSEHKRQTLPHHPCSPEQPHDPRLQDLTHGLPWKGASGSSQPQILQPRHRGCPANPKDTGLWHWPALCSSLLAHGGLTLWRVPDVGKRGHGQHLPSCAAGHGLPSVMMLTAGWV